MLKSFFAALLLTASPTGVRAFASCSEGFSEISVENVNGIFCVKGSTICASDISQGACPAVQEGLAYGSYCGVVASGVYGCKALDSESVKTFQPWVEPGSTSSPTTADTPPTTGETPAPTTADTPAPTSVETPAPITAETPAPTTADTLAPTTAETPAPTFSETPTPTTVITVETPVPIAAETPAPSTLTPSIKTCDNGGSLVSVEGVEGVYCVTGSPVCSGEVSTGVCPAAQSGLPLGSYCGKVASGVYGCKVLTDSVSTPSPTPTPTTAATNPSSTPSVSPTPATATPAPTATTPAPATTTTTPTTTPATATTISSADCPNGGSPMSIEGVQKIFCVTGIACAADIATGNCPGKQEGLPFGSFCDVVRTGVYGCRPFVGENQKPNFTITPPRSCAGNPAGNTSVSIVGAMSDFCAQEPICSGTRNGNCPGIQEGLARESICSLISYSVHGCIFKP